jgi:hypothetical protein
MAVPDLQVPSWVYFLNEHHAFLVNHLKSRIFQHLENYLLHLTLN